MGNIRIIHPIVLVLLFLACGLGDNNTIRLSVDGEEITEYGAKISLSQEGAGIYSAYLMSRGDRVVLAWKVRDKDPIKWVGKRFRGFRFKVKEPTVKVNFDDSEVGILVEISDASGRTVSGRFSGNVGVGAGSHRISNGTFRAPVYFWDR
ncbi:hypothetical protein DRQ36_07150 [bacterium]|nr:MAG: hypothetical protein DRQ36_07150 [bacterium]